MTTLQNRGVYISGLCELCSNGFESVWHLFNNCPLSCECFVTRNMLKNIHNCAENFTELMFNVFDSFSVEDDCKFVVGLDAIYMTKQK